MMFGTKCWVIKKQHVHKMSVVEMRMLKRIKLEHLLSVFLWFEAVFGLKINLGKPEMVPVARFLIWRT